MNKAELIEIVAARIDASKKDTGEAVQAVVDAIQEAVARGQKVSISGFGVFEKVPRPARTYRTPSTGEAIRKVATAVPKFRPGNDFKAFVSGERKIAEQAVRAARGAGDDVLGAAENVVRKVTRKPAGDGEGTVAVLPDAVQAEELPSTEAGEATGSADPSAGAASAETAAPKRATRPRTTTAAKRPAPAKKAPTKRAPAKSSAAATGDGQEAATPGQASEGQVTEGQVTEDVVDLQDSPDTAARAEGAESLADTTLDVSEDAPQQSV